MPRDRDRDRDRSSYKKRSRRSRSPRRDSASPDARKRRPSPSASPSRGRRGRSSGSGSGSGGRRRDSRRSASRSRSPSGSGSDSGSSSGSDSSADYRRRREERRRKREENRRRKEEKRRAKKAAKKAAKARETPHEKAARRLAKKASKTASMFGYTNEVNPFGDSNLSQQFRWHKKDQKEIVEGKRKAPATAKELKQRRKELVDEIVKVKARREQYEREREEREEQRMAEQRAREAEMYGDWEKKEEEFHRVQLKRTSALRIRDGREKPIDMLAKNILLLESGADDGTLSAVIRGDNVMDDAAVDVELAEPYTVLEGLPASELRDLLKEIRTYIDMHEGGEFDEYWKALAMLCRKELTVAEEEEAASGTSAADREAARRRAMHKSVEGRVFDMLAFKSSTELEAMRRDIEDKVHRAEDAARDRRAPARGESVVDREFWAHVLEELDVYKAKARLLELHITILERSLKKLEDRRAAVRRARIASGAVLEDAPGDGAGAGAAAGAAAGASDDSDDDGNLSPDLLDDDDDDVAAAAAAAADDDEDAELAAHTAELDARRAAVVAHHQDSSAAAQAMYDAEAKRGLGAEEELLADEVAVADDHNHWDDKYRPRKPRYLNRVKTGYHWNQYNKTHYDHDNPPPKTVQGYKFNIFYPDLLDRTKTPTYHLEPGASKEFAILRFHAGPPYEDVAFKIVNKEWEYARKHGFRCTFDRGVLQLYFNLKIDRYRR